MYNILRLNKAISIFDSKDINLDNFDIIPCKEKEIIYNILNPIDIIESFRRITDLLVYKLEKLTNYYHSVGYVDTSKKCLFDLKKVNNITNIFKMLDGIAFISLIDYEKQDVSKNIIVKELIKAFKTITTDFNNKKIDLDIFAKYVDENKLVDVNLSTNDKSILFQTLCCLFIFKFYNEELKRAFRLVNKILVVEGVDKVGKSSFVKRFTEKMSNIQENVSINKWKYPKNHISINIYESKYLQLQRIKEQEMYALEIFNDLDELFDKQFTNLSFTVIDRWFLSNNIYAYCSNLKSIEDIDKHYYCDYLATVDNIINKQISKKYEITGIKDYFDIIHLIFYHDSNTIVENKRGDDKIESMFTESEFELINDLYKQISNDGVLVSENLPINALQYNSKIIQIGYKSSKVSNVDTIVEEKVDFFIDMFKNLDNIEYKENVMIKAVKNVIKQLKEMFDSSFRPTLK